MRILVCASDFPYPPRGGMRGDVWRRIEAFVRLGHEVMLVNLYDPQGPRVPTPEALAEADRILTARYSFPIKRSALRTARQLLALWRVPWHAATRVPNDAERLQLNAAVRAFSPTVLWLEGPWFGELVLRLRRELQAPIVYRSHNVEHLYLKRQAAAAAHRRDRVSWRLASVGARRYQLHLMGSADIVFDISLDDLAYWRSLGVSNARWLPPLPELALVEPPTERVASDVLFVGGLRTPNNVAGVRWLVERVLPILRARQPELTVSIVGSYPDPALVHELSMNSAVRTAYDVPDVKPYQFGARVLVNPVATGSGVQVKMIDMLMVDAPIVTRPQGISGLPESWQGQFDVADDEVTFAAAVLSRLDDPGVDFGQRKAVQRELGVDSVQAALSLLPVRD